MNSRRLEFPVRPPVPKLEVWTVDGAPPTHKVEGWEAVNRWGNLNCAAWRAITRRTAFAGMEESEILKLIAAELLRENEEMRDRLWKLAMKYGPEVFFPKG